MIVFIDYILIYSKIEGDHDRHLRIVLHRHRKKKFYSKFSKCKFWFSLLVFLGHVMSEKGIKLIRQRLRLLEGRLDLYLPHRLVVS